MNINVVAAAFALAAAASTTLAQPAPAAATSQKMQLAQQLMQVSGGQERVTASMRTMMGTLDKGLEKNMPPDQARLMEYVQGAIQDEVVTIVPALMQAAERIYADNLTEKEMTDELAWLNSDSGRSIRQKSPAMLQQIAEAEVPMLQAMMPRLGQKVIDRICAEAKCSEHDRQIVTAAMAKAMNTHPG